MAEAAPRRATRPIPENVDIDPKMIPQAETRHQRPGAGKGITQDGDGPSDIADARSRKGIRPRCGPLRFTPDSHGIRARAHLIERSSSYGRWRMHDLVRLYATQLGDERADQDGPEEAMERPLEYCLAITRAAIAYLDPAVAPGRSRLPRTGTGAAVARCRTAQSDRRRRHQPASLQGNRSGPGSRAIWSRRRSTG